MGIKGQVLELRNEGGYQFYLKIGVYEELEDSEEAIFSGDEGLPLDRPLDVYECRLDFSDAEKPVSYPEDRLRECLETFEKHESPEGLAYETQRRWKVGFIADTLLTEAFSSDFMEVIYGDDYAGEGEGGNREPWRRDSPGEAAGPSAAGGAEAAPPSVPAAGRCPDCGAEAQSVATPSRETRPTYRCGVCGRYFTA